MAALKKILSWMLPVKVASYKGEISPVLEVTIENGVKVLNAGRVNYSFGALHTVFQEGFRKIRLEKDPPSSVLILGFGVGSITKIIREEYHFDCPITAVEADEMIITIGKEHFDTGKIPKLELIHARAEEFIRTNTKQFDLIAVDIFVEEEVPESCKTEEFLTALRNALTEKGKVVFNEMPAPHSGEDVFEKRFRKIFPELIIHEIQLGDAPNRIFIGSKEK
jgi:ubiquinone/menaquinone biosynthesis C-methylase UbiE